MKTGIIVACLALMSLALLAGVPAPAADEILISFVWKWHDELGLFLLFGNG